MTSINSKSTKAEILAAYDALKAEPTTARDVIRWTVDKCATIRHETVELAKDVYKLGKGARRWYDLLVAEFSVPLLKPRS